MPSRWVDAGAAHLIRRITEHEVEEAVCVPPDATLRRLDRVDGIDGFEVCRRIRARSDVPIVMLTARGDETDRIVGLELGADDYLPKPFDMMELLARIEAVLRRRQGVKPGMTGTRTTTLTPFRSRDRKFSMIRSRSPPVLRSMTASAPTSRAVFILSISSCTELLSLLVPILALIFVVSRRPIPTGLRPPQRPATVSHSGIPRPQSDISKQRSPDMPEITCPSAGMRTGPPWSESAFRLWR